ncbi:MAG: hypothetical protein K9N51_12590 [Candidatus Pacebacteria bacterium]|nr:hypothetical protein [Candidatus Paceibacterota bacterium]
MLPRPRGKFANRSRSGTSWIHYLGAGQRRWIKKRHLPRGSGKWRVWLLLIFTVILLVATWGAWQEIRLFIL